MIRNIEPDELSLTRTVSHSFFEESGLPGTFKFDHWAGQWSQMIHIGLGTIICYFNHGKIEGIIGGLACECTMTKDMEAIEAFWYIMPEHRGGTAGIRLLQAFEKWARDRAAVRVKMMHLSRVNPEIMESIYKRLGYTKLETAYAKNL